jgi:hypothetical protein
MYWFALDNIGYFGHESIAIMGRKISATGTTMVTTVMVAGRIGDSVENRGSCRPGPQRRQDSQHQR